MQSQSTPRAVITRTPTMPALAPTLVVGLRLLIDPATRADALRRSFVLNSVSGRSTLLHPPTPHGFAAPQPDPEQIATRFIDRPHPKPGDVAIDHRYQGP